MKPTGILNYAYWNEAKKKVIFRLEEDVRIFSFVVKKGFETDFASIPRWARF